MGTNSVLSHNGCAVIKLVRFWVDARLYHTCSHSMSLFAEMSCEMTLQTFIGVTCFCVQVPASINCRLLQHQREGVKFLYNIYKNNHGGVLGDDM